MAAGDFLVRRNVSNTDAIPASGSDLLLLWDTQDSIKGTAVTYSSGTFTLVDSGKYLVLCSDYERGLGIADNSRINTKMTLNLGGAEQLQGYSSGFIRNINSGDSDSVPYSAAIITANSGSQLQIRKERVDNTAQVSNRVANDRSGVTVIKLDDTLDYGVYEGALFATSATDNASVVADISTTIEQDSSLSRSGNVVTISETGRYLAVYTLKSEDSLAVDRSEYQSNISVNGTESMGSWGQTYIRSSDDCTWGGISNASLLNLSANDDVTVNVVSREGGGETFLATLQLMKLPDTAKTITTTATTGNFTILDIDFDWLATEHIDSDVFSFTNGTSDITVLADDDYIALTGQASLSYLNAERRIPAVQFKLNNITLNIAGNSCYSRGIDNAGYQTLTTGGLISALTNDYIGTYNNRISDAGTETNCDSGAMSLIQLSSIVGGVAPTDETNSDISVTIPAPLFSISSTVTAPTNNETSILFEIDSPLFSVSATADLPIGVNSGASFDIPSPQFSVSAESIEPEFNSDASFTIQSPTFSVSARAFEPGSISDISFSVTSPTFSIAATAEQPEVTGIRAGRITGSRRGNYNSRSLRVRRESVNIIYLQFNISDEIIDIEYVISRSTNVVKTLSGGGIALIDGAYNVILDELDTTRTGYFRHYVTITTTLGKIKLSLDKGRIYVN